MMRTDTVINMAQEPVFSHKVVGVVHRSGVCSLLNFFIRERFGQEATVTGKSLLQWVRCWL